MDEVSPETVARSPTAASDDDAWSHHTWEILLLLSLLFAYAGDATPMINESHYLVKAKNFWDPSWCSNDLFAASAKAHTTFYVLFGWPTLFISLEATAWIGRLVSWTIIAIGLQRLSWNLFGARFVSLPIAVVWLAGIEYGDLAGEWVVGGVEAKVPAYGFVMLALSQMVCRRWNRVWILLGLASAFHVLTGGWSVIAAMIAWWRTERPRSNGARLITPALFAGGALSLFGLLPSLALTAGTTPEDSTAAARIYTYYRIKHHLLPADFAVSWYLRHGILIAGTTALALRFGRDHDRLRRLIWFTAGALSIAVTGFVLGLLPSLAPDLAARLLRYYWFRLSDAMIPLMFAVLVAALLLDPTKRMRQLGMTLTIAAALLIGGSTVSRSRLGVPPSVSNKVLGRDISAPAEVQRQVFRDWLAVCRWAQLSTGKDEVFLTPRHQQTFKWYAGRAEVVNWKDVPQDAASLREWYRRFQDVFPARLGQVRVTIRYDKLREYRETYGVRFLIVDRRVAGQSLPLRRVYPIDRESNATYAVYELPR